MFIIDDILIAGVIGGVIGGAIGGAIGGVISLVIDVFLDENSIRDEVHTRYPNALKLLIQEKKANAVKVGIFREYDDEIETGIEISSSEGVSDNLYVGQEIYL